jgi:hypothetical protein
MVEFNCGVSPRSAWPEGDSTTAAMPEKKLDRRGREITFVHHMFKYFFVNDFTTSASRREKASHNRPVRIGDIFFRGAKLQCCQRRQDHRAERTGFGQARRGRARAQGEQERSGNNTINATQEEVGGG